MKEVKRPTIFKEVYGPKDGKAKKPRNQMRDLHGSRKYLVYE